MTDAPNTKLIAIGAIVVLEGVLAAVMYFSDVVDDKLILGLAGLGVVAIAGLAGYNMAKKPENPEP